MKLGRKSYLSGRIVALLLMLFFLCSFMGSASAQTTVTVISGISKVDPNTSSTSNKYDSHWQYWSQGASKYLNSSDTSKLRNMPQYGCRVVAQSKLLVEAGLASSDVKTFNPDIYFEWTVANNFQNSSPWEHAPIGEAIIQWAKNKGTTVTRTEETYTGVDQVMAHIRAGRYVIMSCTAHQAYIGRAASLNYGSPVVLDSGGWTSCNPTLPVALSGYGRTSFTSIFVYTVGELKGTIDVNGRLDGINKGGTEGFGTFDIVVGSDSKNDVSDYYASFKAGTAYRLSDIKALPGYDYLGIVSGKESGTISAGQTLDVRLNFATQGNLHIQGNLDGVVDDSIANYGTFDVYVGGILKASNCTSFNQKLPNGSTYEVKNIKAVSGKNYGGLTSFTGTVKSNTESKVVLSYTSDGTATPDWQTGKAVPGNLDRDMLDIEYKYTYSQNSRTSPGSDWTLVKQGTVQYENDGATYYDDNDALPTTATRVLVGYYYFHYCNNGATANYYKKDYLPIKHTVTMEDAAANFSVKEMGTDGDGSGRKYYYLTHLNGQWAGGIATCGSNGSKVYYRGGVYQNKKAYQINTYQKIGDWTGNYDPNASSYEVRWRLKDGVSAEYKGLELKFFVNGQSVDSLDGVAGLNVFINGEQKASNATTFRSFFPGEFAYQIEIANIATDKIYNGINGGELNGVVTEDLKTLTLYFETGVQAEVEWKEIPASLLPYVDDNSEIEYRHTYTQQARTSPGDGWTLVKEGAVQYENDGARYESDNELSTSATRVLVGYYYFHWCNNGVNANYYQKDYLPVYHKVSMEDAAANFSVKEMGTDGDGSGRKYYYLTHLNGQWEGGIATCGTNGSRVYYRGGVYQNKKAYQINTYSRTGDWTTELDTTATTVEYRIRLKKYTIEFNANGGIYNAESIIKFSGEEVTLPTEIPFYELYNFVAWNTKANGSGKSYAPGAKYNADEDTVLYAQWKSVPSMNIPNGVTIIEEEAFAGINAVVVTIPESCQEIKSNAFLNCSNLKRIYVPATTTKIAVDAFDGCVNLVIYAPAGSTAIKVAKYNDMTFEEILYEEVH